MLDRKTDQWIPRQRSRTLQSASPEHQRRDLRSRTSSFDSDPSGKKVPTRSCVSISWKLEKSERKDVTLEVAESADSLKRLPEPRREQLRQRESANGCLRWPVMALTRNAIKEEQDECLAAGRDGCVTKPLTMSELQALVAETRIAVKPQHRAVFYCRLSLRENTLLRVRTHFRGAKGDTYAPFIAEYNSCR